MSKDEARRECQREFQQVMKPKGISKIMHIEIQSEANPNEIKKITDRNKMEQIMMKNFKQFFWKYMTPVQQWSHYNHGWELMG